MDNNEIIRLFEARSEQAIENYYAGMVFEVVHGAGVLQEPDRSSTLRCSVGTWKAVSEGYWDFAQQEAPPGRGLASCLSGSDFFSPQHLPADWSCGFLPFML